VVYAWACAQGGSSATLALRATLQAGTPMAATLHVGFRDSEDRLVLLGDTRGAVNVERTQAEGVWDGVVWGLQVPGSGDTVVIYTSMRQHSSGADSSSDSDDSNRRRRRRHLLSSDHSDYGSSDYWWVGLNPHNACNGNRHHPVTVIRDKSALPMASGVQ